MGITYFTSILNPPQVGLLGIGRIRPLPVCEGSDFRLENTVMLSLTVDHQAVDGTTGARFLSDLSDFIRDFDLLAIK
jgi:pyruvate dehydrogenase E2 component (dihydrolipoamide acetyltransferase)